MLSLVRLFAGSLMLAFSICVTCSAADTSGVTPVALRCEYLNNPQGIDQLVPRLMWRIDSEERGQRQTAYRVLVTSSLEKIKHGEGDLWDSKKVASNQTAHIEYGGSALKSGQQCYWSVRVWDRNDVASSWSEPAHWSMGIVSRENWKAQYISYRDETPVHNDRNSLFLPAARQYRKEFPTETKIRRATVYATALEYKNSKSTASVLAIRTLPQVGPTTTSELTTTRTTSPS